MTRRSRKSRKVTCHKVTGLVAGTGDLVTGVLVTQYIKEDNEEEHTVGSGE
jgi:pyridoxal/pyridoxine/pyridoxamine kinase